MLKFVEIIRKTLRDVKSFAKNIKLRIRFASLKEECLVLVSFCASQITTVICYLSSDNVAIQQPQRSSLSWGKGLLDALELLPWAGLGFALCNMLLTAGTSPGADIRVLFPKQPRPISLYFIIFQRLSTTLKDSSFNIFQLLSKCYHISTYVAEFRVFQHCCSFHVNNIFQFMSWLSKYVMSFHIYTYFISFNKCIVFHHS